MLRTVRRLTACRRLQTAVSIFIMFAVFFTACWTRLDPDFGWHLQAGTYIRAHGIPSHDIFSYSAPGFRWIDHEWGSNVLISIVYQYGGFAALSLVFAAIWSAALALTQIARKPVILLVAVSALLPYVLIRPYAWTVLCFSTLLVLLKYRPKWYGFAIPLLFLIWANLHGGFVIGLAAIAFLAVKQHKRSLAAVLVASALLTFINPYGPRLYTEIYRTLTDFSVHAQIAEWRSFHFFTESMEFVVLWVAAYIWYDLRLGPMLLTFISEWKTKRRLLANKKGRVQTKQTILMAARRLFSLNMLLFLGALSATRNVPFFILGASDDLMRYNAAFLRSLPRRLTHLQRTWLLVGYGSVIVWLAAVLIAVFAFSPWQREANFPTGAVAYLKQHPCQGQLFNDYNYGGYLIWKLPGTKDFIDGRMPTWRNASGQKYFDIYHKIISSPAYRAQQFSHYSIRCVLLTQNNTERQMAAGLQRSGWRTVASGSTYQLLLAP